LGHVAWFQEKWVLRHAAGQQPMRADGDSLYDSAAIPHDTRWHLPLPSRAETLRYLAEVEERVVEHIRRTGFQPVRPGTDRLETCPTAYFSLLTVYHEDMHAEAFTYTRQALDYRAPFFDGPRMLTPAAEAVSGDALVPGGTFELGAVND